MRIPLGDRPDPTTGCEPQRIVQGSEITDQSDQRVGGVVIFIAKPMVQAVRVPPLGSMLADVGLRSALLREYMKREVMALFIAVRTRRNEHAFFDKKSVPFGLFGGPR